MASGSKFIWNPGTVATKLQTAQSKAVDYITKTTVYYSLVAETQARKGAKWTDRSGNARSGLTGTYDVTQSAGGATFEFELAHSVNYGIWLETKQFSRKGKLAIIRPTLDVVQVQYMQTVQKVLDRMFS